MTPLNPPPAREVLPLEAGSGQDRESRPSVVGPLPDAPANAAKGCSDQHPEFVSTLEIKHLIPPSLCAAVVPSAFERQPMALALPPSPPAVERMLHTTLRSLQLAGRSHPCIRLTRGVRPEQRATHSDL
jgi:hypothetical protein